MALDGAFLYTIKQEIEQVALGSRVEKIYQPSREEIIIALRWKGGNAKLLLSAGANSPRIHFTGIPLENPKSPPMFCMLLRKHLNSGKLVEVKQMGLDRTMHLVFESVNELGDLVTVTLAVEIMGRHSNIIVINQDGKIIDSIKRIDNEMSSVRMVLPGMSYTLPPIQHKINLFEASPEEVLKNLETTKNAELSKALVAIFQGMSPILCREIAAYVTRGTEIYKDDLTDDMKTRLLFFLNQLKSKINERQVDYTIVYEKNGKPKDFSFIEIGQYGSFMLTKKFDSASELLDNFYSERDRIERMKQRSNDLLKMLVNKSERISRKLHAQREELLECANRETFKIYGDLLSTNLHQLKKGIESITLQNYYDPEFSDVQIKLDPSLQPAQNAQKYYNEYRKAATAEKMLKKLIKQAEEELIYLDTVFDSVARTTGESELLEIREELSEQGYIKNYKNKNKQLKPQPPLKYVSSEGFVILCGRNNKQNDKLTLREARNHDIWCHTHNIPGSHVIIVTQGQDVSDKTVEQACIIAAFNSKARNSAQVPVDYTEIKNVKKPNGAKPGMVIFENNKTAYVTPDENTVNQLRV
ncbi:MAG: hypothetical protein K0R90_203 [Oscillospiraceae bacterium]|nr:hypothetical protein [Oscillospiraceae bacterium]